MLPLLQKFAQNCHGATAIEYALVAGIMAISLALGLTTLSDGVAALLRGAGSALSAQ
jgi:Flp pilus assembly pilin Flp